MRVDCIGHPLTGFHPQGISSWLTDFPACFLIKLKILHDTLLHDPESNRALFFHIWQYQIMQLYTTLGSSSKFITPYHSDHIAHSLVIHDHTTWYNSTYQYEFLVQQRVILSSSVLLLMTHHYKIKFSMNLCWDCSEQILRYPGPSPCLIYNTCMVYLRG